MDSRKLLFAKEVIPWTQQKFEKKINRRSTSIHELSVESRDSNSDDSLEVYEDWRNKVKRSSQPHVGNRSRRSANSIMSKHNPEYFRSNISLLSNGYESPKFFTERTCAFDSIYPIICVAYLDYDVHETADSQFGTFVRMILNSPKSLTKVYNLRNQILYGIFSSDAYLLAPNITQDDTVKQNRTKIHIDCFTG